MGICYAQQEEWEVYENNYRTKRKNRKKADFNSIIYEQKSVHESFASKVENSFRDDLHRTLNLIASSDSSSIAFGSIAEMTEQELDVLYKTLQQVNPDAEKFNHNQVLSFCNLKTKNFLHTHKIRHPQLKKFNEVSACPYSSNHVIEYDLWKIIPLENQRNYIYHPLTQSFLGIEEGKLVCGIPRFEWKIIDFGPRRNGGFIKLIADWKDEELQLCMTDEPGILPNHRRLELCNEKHIGHLWEINFGQCILE